MSPESRATTDHGEIREWVEERDGRPADVESTEDGDSSPPRIDFPDGTGGDDEDATLAFLSPDGNASYARELTGQEA